MLELNDISLRILHYTNNYERRGLLRRLNMLKKFTTCAFIVTLISSVLIGSNIIFANDKGEDIQAKPPTLEIMVKQASKDSTLLEMLNQFSDQDTIIAYPENMGGGFSVKSSDSSEPLVGEILDIKGEKVIYKDSQPVTIAQVKEAIQNK